MRNKNTLFVGKVLLRFPVLNSTNAYALELLAKSKPIEGTAISTYQQTEGRGQIGSRWESEPDKNLAISVIFYPEFLAARQQFLLNQAVALAVADCLSEYLEPPVLIKWPNDIYVRGNKIAGILIQNALSGTRFLNSVVGIGVNVNQTVFSPDLPNPVSMQALSGVAHELDELAAVLCHHLEVRYLQLRSHHPEDLRNDYLRRLYRFGEWSDFQRPGAAFFRGRISGVSEEGKLLVEREDGALEAFDLKEIIYR